MTSPNKHILKKWDVWLADLNPRFGTELGKLRPVVIIQSDLLNDTDHPSTIVCSMTSQVELESKLLRIHVKKNEAGLTEDSDILADQIRAIDNERFKKRLGTIKPIHRAQLMESLYAVLDL